MSQTGPRLLIITTKFPPSIGGIQTYMFNLFNRFRRHMPTWTLLPGRCPEHIRTFGPYAVIRGLWMCRKLGITHLLIGDGTLAPIGYCIARLSRVKVSIAVHGLDIVKPGRDRQIAWFLRRHEVVVCNSRATRASCIDLGVDPAKCVVVPCGVELEANERRQPQDRALAELGESLGRDLSGKTILVHVGRIIERKGVAWFVANVVPRLPDHCVFVVAGEGTGLDRVREAVQTGNCSARVHLLGRVSHHMLNVVFDAAHAFVMPNIRVRGDMEGFGIVMLEAGVRNVPVVASGIEGIADAVVEGVTGTLVDEGDPDAFERGIREVLTWDSSSGRIREAVRANYGWDRVYPMYAAALGIAKQGPGTM